MTYRYTFEMKEWNRRKVSLVSKVFSYKLNINDIRNELGLLFDTGLYKNVMVKKAEQLDEIGQVIKKIDLNKWQ